MKLIQNKIKFPPRKNNKQIINYFKKHKIWQHLKSPIIKKRNLKDLIDPWTNSTYLPELKDLSKKFEEVCKKLCKENNSIMETLINLEPKNES